MSSETSYENGRLTFTRFYKAPITAVFDAWIKTSKVQLWWGCEGAVSVQSEVEPKVGGKYAHTMILENVGEYRHHGRIIEYEPPRLLAYELSDAFHDKTMLVRVEFIEQDGSTRVQLKQTNLLDLYVEFVTAGWTFSLANLATFLEETNETSDSLPHVLW
ncbi:MAG: SRPBCC domain-containing protein [Chloroflexota bacterium]